MTEQIHEPIDWEIPSKLHPELFMADDAAELAADIAAHEGKWEHNHSSVHTTEGVIRLTSIKKDVFEPLGVDSSERAIARYTKIKQ